MSETRIPNSGTSFIKYLVVFALGIIVTLGILFREAWLIPKTQKPKEVKGIPQLVDATTHIKSTTEEILPGRYLYHDGWVYIVTEIKLADEDGSVATGREYIRTQVPRVAMGDKEITIVTPLPPSVRRYEIYGKKIVEVIQPKG